MRKFTSTLRNTTLHAHYCKLSIENKTCGCPTIKSTNKVKYLSVILEETLSFKQHIGILNTRLRKLIFIFKKLRYIADSKIIRQVYFDIC
jgi:hypothetical protein